MTFQTDFELDLFQIFNALSNLVKQVLREIIRANLSGSLFNSVALEAIFWLLANKSFNSTRLFFFSWNKTCYWIYLKINTVWLYVRWQNIFYEPSIFYQTIDKKLPQLWACSVRVSFCPWAAIHQERGKRPANCALLLHSSRNQTRPEWTKNCYMEFLFPWWYINNKYITYYYSFLGTDRISFFY